MAHVRIACAWFLLLALTLCAYPLALAQMEMESDGYWVCPVDDRLATRTGYIMRIVNNGKPELSASHHKSFITGVRQENAICICHPGGSMCAFHMLGIQDLASIEVGKTYTAENIYDRFGLPLIKLRYNMGDNDHSSLNFCNFPNEMAWGIAKQDRCNQDAKQFTCRFDRCDDEYIVGYASFVGDGDLYELYFAIETQRSEKSGASASGNLIDVGEASRAEQICGHCGGSGRSICPDCDGQGKNISPYHVNDDGQTSYMTLNCGRCGGVGLLVCSRCGGSGFQ